MSCSLAGLPRATGHSLKYMNHLLVMTSSKHNVYQQSKLQVRLLPSSCIVEPTRLPETSGIVLVGLRSSRNKQILVSIKD